MVTLALLLAALAQDAAEVRSRLWARHEELVPHATADERARVVDAWTKAVLDVRRHGHDPRGVLDRLDWTLANAAYIGPKVKDAAVVMSHGLETKVPDVRRRLEPPEELLGRERRWTIEVASAYVEEVVARPKADEEERAEIRRQFERVREEIRAAARPKIYGPYGEDVLRISLDRLSEDQLGSDLGDPLEGALSRPLSSTELEAVLRDVREQIGAMPPVEAASPADRLFVESKGRSPTVGSDAVKAASAAGRRIFLMAEILYPRHVASMRELRVAQREIIVGLNKAWEGVAADLERKGVRISEASPEEALKVHGSLDAGDRVSPEPGPATRRAAAASSTSSSAGKRGWALALLALLGVAAVALLRRRKPGLALKR
jgi:MYXO-CTERM domain-containing protein